MGFRDWFEGFIFVALFAIIVGLPCFFVTVLGSKTINDLGNFPTKAPKIQVGVLWKLVLVEAVSFLMFIVFFHIFS